MFGRSKDFNSQPAPQPSAPDMAHIQGGGMVHVFISDPEPLTFSVFLNERIVPGRDVESLTVAIDAPDETGYGGSIHAVLSHNAQTVAGRQLQALEIFPGTLEIIGVGRRILVTCNNPDSFEGLWISLGIRPDGTARELTGVKSLRFLLTDSMLDAKITWVDGRTENLLPTIGII